MNSAEDYYWSVDLFGLTEDGAERIAAYSESMALAEGSSVVDPRHFFTGHFDVETVKDLIAALRFSLTGELLPADTRGMKSMLESLQEWLQHAHISEDSRATVISSASARTSVDL